MASQYLYNHRHIEQGHLISTKDLNMSQISAQQHKLLLCITSIHIHEPELERLNRCSDILRKISSLFFWVKERERLRKKQTDVFFKSHLQHQSCKIFRM